MSGRRPATDRRFLLSISLLGLSPTEATTRSSLDRLFLRSVPPFLPNLMAWHEHTSPARSFKAVLTRTQPS